MTKVRPQCQSTPTMFMYTYIYSHNVPLVRANKPTNKQRNTPTNKQMNVLAVGAVPPLCLPYRYTWHWIHVFSAKYHIFFPCNLLIKSTTLYQKKNCFISLKIWFFLINFQWLYIDSQLTVVILFTPPLTFLNLFKSPKNELSTVKTLLLFLRIPCVRLVSLSARLPSIQKMVDWGEGLRTKQTHKKWAAVHGIQWIPLSSDWLISIWSVEHDC